MNVRIENLPENVLATYAAVAHARGVALDDLLREFLIKNAPPTPPAQMSAEEWERAFDELFDSFPALEPLPDSAFDRDSIYSREDKW